MIDYLSCILFKVFGFCLRCLPLSLSCFLGRRLGDLLYCFDSKHRAIAYANVLTAFGRDLPPAQLKRLVKDFYRCFGQNLFDVFLIPLIDKNYMDKYVSVEGRQHIDEAFKKKKGVILLGAHAGSWELSNITCANLGFPFSVLVREQKFPRLNRLLNSYRTQRGAKLIERQSQTRQLIESLQKNEAVGLTVDQGGKNGCLVEFFGRNASMATGAVKLALKYQAVILPGYYARVKGPYIKTIIEPPFEVKNTGDLEKDIHDNLQALIRIFEKNIKKYAKDYFWNYKIWKYTDRQNILILSDGKVGHLRQAQAAAKIAQNLLQERSIRAEVDTVEVKFRNKFSRYALTLNRCASCLKSYLDSDSYKALKSKKYDIIISCGSSLAAANLFLSKENLAKSIVIMRPSILSLKKFDLVIMPRHDNPRARKNVVVTEGALNLIDEQYLKEQSEKLIQVSGLRSQASVCIGLLIGGDTKNFTLAKETISAVIRQIKQAAQDLGADILVTTSRRTSKEVEEILKQEFKGYARCKLLIIANERNVPEAVGGILGLSQIVVTSAESISMVSEAASSKKHVFVFECDGLSKKHRRFVEGLARKNYIYLTRAEDLGKKIEETHLAKPQVQALNDSALVERKIGAIL